MWRTLLLLVTAGAAFGEEPFSFAKTPGRLPKDVIPRHYGIGLDFRQAGKGDFSGTEVIEVEVLQPVRQVVFNSLDLHVGPLGLWGKKTEPSVTGTDATVKIVTDDRTQLATIHFETEQPPGVYRLQFTWVGKLTEKPQGIFFTRYATPTGEKAAITTQMEAVDARRMFPCWDEPAFRAVFELSVVVPEKDLTFSNMPIVSEVPSQTPGFKAVTFAPTPSMASYLLAFTSGELEAIEGEVEGVHLRMITTPGQSELARYALEATKQILPFYNDYFDTRYPLPKLDQFCYPGFAAGGMENWGAIHYNDTALLVDPKTGTQPNRERVFGVVAHEIAHQWFGDLVTTGWWDNLWLNEGFASWMATKATDRFHADWRSRERAAGAKEHAMHRDSRSTTHPIQQPVLTEAQASDAFDEITYQKGESFLHMLEAYLGDVPFRAGIRRYMARHAYGNTTTADLWTALEEASGKPVRAFAAGWTTQPGFPVVLASLACREGMQHLTLAQERFTIHQASPAPLVWQVPVAWHLLTPTGPPLLEVLGEKPASAEAGPCPTPYLLNAGSLGYYRVQYDAENLARLTALAPTLPEPDRLGLLLDSWALLQAGRQPAAPFFALLEKIAPVEEGLLVWPEIVRLLQKMDHLQRGQPGQPAFRAWARRLVHQEAARLGWTGFGDESALAKSLRGQLLGALGEWEDEATLAEGLSRFEDDEKNPGSIEAELRPVVLRLAGQRADAALWERLHQHAKAAPTFELKNQYYRALGACRRPELAAKTLQLSLGDEMPPTNSTRFVEMVADSAQLPELAWAFARKHAQVLLAKLPSIRGDSYLPGLASNFSEEAAAVELESFAKANLPASSAPGIARATDEIRFKAEFKARFLPELDRHIATP